MKKMNKLNQSTFVQPTQTFLIRRENCSFWTTVTSGADEEGSGQTDRPFLLSNLQPLSESPHPPVTLDLILVQPGSQDVLDFTSN